MFDTSRRGTTEKPVVSNLLTKVVPQAKINLIQSIDIAVRQAKAAGTSTIPQSTNQLILTMFHKGNAKKLNSKSPRNSANSNNSYKRKEIGIGGTASKSSNNLKMNLHHDTEESDSQLSDSSRSPKSNLSVDGASSTFRSLINEQKKRLTYNQFHAKSKSPPTCGKKHEHSPGLDEYRNLIKKALNENFSPEVKSFEVT